CAVLLVRIPGDEFVEHGGLGQRRTMKYVTYAAAVTNVLDAMAKLVIVKQHFQIVGCRAQVSPALIITEVMVLARCHLLLGMEVFWANLIGNECLPLTVKLGDQVIRGVVAVFLFENAVPPNLDQSLLEVIDVLGGRAAGINDFRYFSRMRVTVRD